MTPQKAVKIMVDAGFADAGVCPFGPWALRQSKKARDIPDGISSVLIGVLPYYGGDMPGRNLSLYAVLPDYHDTLKNMLEAAAGHLRAHAPGHIFLPFADDSPVREVEAACRAGLGARGRHNLLITPRFGSFVFIGELLTTLNFGAVQTQTVNPCGDCGICVGACPTGALDSGFKKELCLSYISQKKGNLSRNEERLLSRSACAFGCDICQLVCPFNGRAEPAAPCSDFLWSLSLEKLESMSPGQFRQEYAGRAFTWRGLTTLIRNLRLQRKG